MFKRGRVGKKMKRAKTKEVGREHSHTRLPHLRAYLVASRGKITAKGQSDFLNHFNKLEECDCPDSAAVSVC